MDTRAVESTLITERGSKSVTPEELREYRAPSPVGRWFPVPHYDVWKVATDSLTSMGFTIAKQSLTVARGGDRFFGTIDLQSEITEGVSVAVGIRNSIDKSISIGLALGARVFVCENLQFSAEVVIARKHTKLGGHHFANDINGAVSKIERFRTEESNRIGVMRNVHIGDERAESLVVRAMDRGIITSQDIPKVLTEWRVPEFKEFEDRTLYSLLNAFTAALKPKCDANPQRYASLTMKLSAHLIPPEYLTTLAS